MLKQFFVLFLLVLFLSGCVSTRSAWKNNPAPQVAGIVMGRPPCH